MPALSAGEPETTFSILNGSFAILLSTTTTPMPPNSPARILDVSMSFVLAAAPPPPRSPAGTFGTSASNARATAINVFMYFMMVISRRLMTRMSHDEEGVDSARSRDKRDHAPRHLLNPFVGPNVSHGQMLMALSQNFLPRRAASSPMMITPTNPTMPQ